MLSTTDIMIIILVIMNIISFGIGYLLAKLNFGYINIIPNKEHQVVQQVKHNISIDDTKFVTKISTDGMEKKYNCLGETTVIAEDINSSVNKLKNLKK